MSGPATTVRVPFETVHRELARVLVALGFEPQPADACARLFAETSLDGVETHGIARFPRFVRQIRAGYVKPGAEPRLVAAHGALERWDGQLGPGNLNAQAATARAVALAREHGIGAVALRGTNHWMRGGTYGWQAASAGFGFIGWTNTMPNLPPWGAREARLGNNPLVLAVPRAGGPLVLDMAMSQFSFGAMELAARAGRRLTVPGGFDAADRMTDDPAAILESWRPLPVGYWKGAALALVLDAFAVFLGAGSSTRDIGTRAEEEYGVSQVFIACDASALGDGPAIARTLDAIVEDLHATPSIDETSPLRYPGERALRARADNLANGIPIDGTLWEEIRRL